MKNKKGFTLIELIVLIAIIGILTGIVILIINPSKKMAEGRNNQRRNDINIILNAVYQYKIDHNGALPEGVTENEKSICNTGSNCAGLVDLKVLTENEKYLESIPKDPIGYSGADSGYGIKRCGDGSVVINALKSEQGLIISATK